LEQNIYKADDSQGDRKLHCEYNEIPGAERRRGFLFFRTSFACLAADRRAQMKNQPASRQEGKRAKKKRCFHVEAAPIPTVF
jgi:hypothetical protein